MQNTITARRVSSNLVALMVLLVAVALLVGFVAGFAINKPSSAEISPAVAQPNAPTTGWVYQYNSLNSKWYVQHFATTLTGSVIDEIYEMRNGPGNSANGCGLNRAEPDC